MSDWSLPILDLVETRLKKLGMGRNDLARRCGYKNVNKGVRRIEAICCGDFESAPARTILRVLSTALEVSQGVVDVHVRQSANLQERAKRMGAAERDAAWRTSFKPHAYLLGTETRPSSITIFGITGGAESWLTIPLDLSQSPVRYAMQALAFVRKTPVVPFFGATTGFIVNYTPDHAVRFDLDGNPTEFFPRAYSPQKVTLTVGGRKMAAGDFARIVGLVRQDGDVTPAG
jgi:hypothetical protein